MNIELNAADFAQLADFWTRAPEITRTRLMQAAQSADNLLQGGLKEDLPRGSGGAAGLAGSIQTDEQAFDDNVIGTVFTAQPYAVYVELGTGPHLAPIQPLIDWVKVKFGLLDLSAKNTAYAVRASIAKHGTKANPVWQNTWNKKLASVRAIYDAAMAAIANDLASGAPA